MSLRIYNTLSRALEDFSPLEPGHVRMYVCGMTIYDLCHIGHVRMMMAFDVVQRWLKASGMRVTYVRNITDIDDKIIKRALERGITIRQLTDEMIAAMHQDIGALGIIIPMVDDVKKVHDAIKFAHFPPLGKRSQGGGQYRQLWGDDYRATANDNIMIVAMIENPEGVAIADKIAAIPEVDVVFAASTDLSSFSGWKQGEPKYEAMVKEIHDKVLKAGKVLAGPMAWRDRDGYKFFQAPGTSAVIRAGTKALISGEVSEGPRRGVAPTEGSEPKK